MTRLGVVQAVSSDMANRSMGSVEINQSIMETLVKAEMTIIAQNMDISMQPRLTTDNGPLDAKKSVLSVTMVTT